MEHSFIYEFSFVVVIGIVGQWLAWIFKFPAIILWMALGWFFGQKLGYINPSQSLGGLFHPVIEIASAIILFEGGLSLKYKEFRKVGAGIRRLVTSGLILHLTLLTSAGYFIAGWKIGFSLLVGSILIVTGPTVITPIIRQIRMKSAPATYLKWEGIINDPVGALLSVLMVNYLSVSGKSGAGTETLLSLTRAIFISIGMALGLTYSVRWSYKKSLVPDFLKVPIIFAFVLVLFTASNYLQEGAGLLSVTLFGLFLGNQSLPIIEDVKKFKEPFSTFLIAILFVFLSATLELEKLSVLKPKEWVFIAAVLFGLRPIAIMISTIKGGMDWKERVTVSWFAPRGIVAASVAGVVAHKLEVINHPNSDKFVPVVFAVILLSVSIYGLSIRWLASILKLTGRKRGGVILAVDSLWGLSISKEIGKTNLKTLVISNNPDIAQKAREMNLHSIEGEVIKVLDSGVIDLVNYSYILAATRNDSYNSLICQKTSHSFGSSNVYQLPFVGDKSTDPEILPEALRGRFINEELNYSVIDELVAKGAQFSICEERGCLRNENKVFVLFSFSDAYEMSSKPNENSNEYLVLEI